MRTFIGKVFGKAEKAEKVEEKDINLDKVSYFNESIKNEIDEGLKKCNEKAKIYLQKYGTVKGFECQFEIKNCLDKDETVSLMKSVSPEIKFVKSYDWLAPGCQSLTFSSHGSTTIWDSSNYSKQHVSKQ